MSRAASVDGSRVAQSFRRANDAGRTALITYVMAGDPSVSVSRTMAIACAAGGADLLEIGMPFSDPIADGPTIQRAAERSLAAGTSVADCLAVAAAVRKKTDAAIALMGYVNPILSYGMRRFFADAAKAGVDATILPDLLPEESDEYCALAQRHGIKTVFLLAPTSTAKRQDEVFRRATGFVYFVSVTGVTGARTELPSELVGQLDALRGRSPVPVAVGFGIAGPPQVEQLAAHAEGVVVGSAIVHRIAAPGAAALRAKKVTAFVRSLSRATVR
jgi:tryptophan synthase alpha chain